MKMRIISGNNKNPALRRGVLVVGLLWGGWAASAVGEVTRDPAQADAYYRAGVERVAQGDLTAAETAFRQAIALESKSVAAHIALGDLYLTGFEKPQEAVHAYRAAVASNPQHSGARYGLGIALAATDRAEDAEKEFTEAARLAPTNPLPLQALGRLHASRRQPEKARHAFDAAIAADPRFAQAYIDRGNLWLAQGDDARAIVEYEQALTIDPNLAEARVRIGMVHQRANRTQEAEQAYAAAIRVNPASRLPTTISRGWPPNGTRILMRRWRGSKKLWS
jgi:tetratricopeptide (TPR) repeat protein